MDLFKSSENTGHSQLPVSLLKIVRKSNEWGQEPYILDMFAVRYSYSRPVETCQCALWTWLLKVGISFSIEHKNTLHPLWRHIRDLVGYRISLYHISARYYWSTKRRNLICALILCNDQDLSHVLQSFSCVKLTYIFAKIVLIPLLGRWQSDQLFAEAEGWDK